MRRNYVFALMLALLGLYAYAAVARPIIFVSSSHPIMHGYHPSPYSIARSALTGIVGLLIAIRTLNPRRYRTVEQWIHAQR
jgi:hypothetical protein